MMKSRFPIVPVFRLQADVKDSLYFPKFVDGEVIPNPYGGLNMVEWGKITTSSVLTLLQPHVHKFDLTHTDSENIKKRWLENVAVLACSTSALACQGNIPKVGDKYSPKTDEARREKYDATLRLIEQNFLVWDNKISGYLALASDDGVHNLVWVSNWCLWIFTDPEMNVYAAV